MKSRYGATALLSILLMSLATPAGAQAPDTSLADLLGRMILRDITLANPETSPHAVHFSPIEKNDLTNPAVGIVQAFNTQLATQFATFPLGTSTGGFTYTLDESLGTFTRSSGSFGPAFSERALTIGQGRLSLGFNYQHTRYDGFEGQDLDDGSIKFYLRHEECCSVNPMAPPRFRIEATPDGTRLSPAFEGDVIEAALALEATTDTFAMFANYGVTDRWDVGIAVPIVSVELDATVQARIVPLSTGRSRIPIHTFEAGNAAATEKTFSEGGSATGLGDIVLRTKYNFLRNRAAGFAIALDVRLPTGDENDLLGAGGTQTKVFFVASAETDRLAPHVNIGYTFSSGDIGGSGAQLTPTLETALNDEFNYTGGPEFVVLPRLTILGEVVGRTLRDAGRLTLASKEFAFVPGIGRPRGPAEVANFDEFQPQSGNLNLALGAAGFKFNPTGNLLISVNMLFPLTDAGLTSTITPVVGVEYAF